MASLTDILSAIQNGVIAANNFVKQTNGSFLNISGQLTSLESPILPTVQSLTAGSSATYTPTSSSIQWIEVLFVGGGGGGAGISNGSSASIAGSSGGVTLFSSWGANGGSGCTGTAVAGITVYGSGGTGGAGTATRRAAGQNGAATALNAQSYSYTYFGGDSFLGRGAPIKLGVAQPQGGNSAAANSGGGGSGSWAGIASFVQGGGGGGGEFVYLLITHPSSAYLYTVGAGGAGGVGTTVTGGAGGSGVIFVVEHYGA